MNSSDFFFYNEKFVEHHHDSLALFFRSSRRMVYGVVVLKNSNQEVAGSSPGRRRFVLEGTQTKNDWIYQVNGRGASAAWTDWNCSMMRCERLGLNPRSPPR